MADFRSSIAAAVNRTLQELESKPPDVQEQFAQTTVPHAEAVMADMELNESVGDGEPPEPPGMRELLLRAQEKLASLEADAVHGTFVHTEDPDVALLLSALEHAAGSTPAAPAPAADDESLEESFALPSGEMIGLHKYDATDPRWILSALNMIVRDKVPFRAPSGPTDAQTQLPDRDITISMAGDWGTGLYSSNQIAKYMAAQKPDITVHLGDVYYSGTEKEVFDKFIKHFPRGVMASFALNANHDMYSGGSGYFNVILRDPDFGHQKQKSFFSLYNRTWQVIGLDTAYESAKAELYQKGVLGAGQLAWFQAQLEQAKAAGRRVIILTHHNPVSIRGGSQDKNMMQQLFGAATRAGSMFEYWIWGHEHGVAVFEPFAWNGANVKGRCIGHGGIPYGVTPGGDKGDGVIVRWTETGTYPNEPRQALNGFGVITLPIAGGELIEKYYDDTGRLRYPLP
jgi:hypothetical protein